MTEASWEDSILGNLNEPQKKAVMTTEGPLLVLAGAGSGKTRTIVHRMAYLIHGKKVPAYRIIAVTFTNKAAQEMHERALNLTGPIASESLIRTYHSLGLYFLRQFAAYLDYPGSFTIWDDTDQRNALKEILAGHFEKEKFNKTQLRYFAQTISSFKDALIGPEELSEEVDLDEYEFGDLLPEVYHLYENVKKNSLAFDFSDLLYQTVYLLENFPEVKERIQSRYEYFLIDEYQDTNHAQYVFINLIASKSSNLCVVGDDDQAIYGWRGADVRNILDFNRDYPDAVSVKLEENYRSTQKILNLANEVIEKNPERMPKKLWTSITGGEDPRLMVIPDAENEARAVSTIIDSLQREIPLEEIAVLYRTNAQSRLLEEALLALKIPYRVYGGVAFFGRKEIKDLLAYMRFLNNPRDRVAFIRILGAPSRGIGEKSVQKLLETADSRGLDSFLDALKSDHNPLSGKGRKAAEGLGAWLTELHEKVKRPIDLGFLLEDILEKSGLREAYEEEDRLIGSNRIEYLTELKNSLLYYQENHTDALLADYLQDITLFTSTDDVKGEEGGVHLMTIHNAKGLEFNTVFLTGLEDGTFPHFLAQREGNLNEERRLFYVAVTRAKERLYMSRAKRRMFQGMYQPSQPSVFLGEISPDSYQMSERGGESFNPGRAGGAFKRSFRPRMPEEKPDTDKSGESFQNTVTMQSSNTTYKAGDRVRHPNFGSGRVLRTEGSGDACKIHIFFEDSKSRKFLLKFTKLEKL